MQPTTLSHEEHPFESATAMEKSPAFIQYELRMLEIKRLHQQGDLSAEAYRDRKVQALRNALPKLTLNELADVDRQSFDLLAEQS